MPHSAPVQKLIDTARQSRLISGGQLAKFVAACDPALLAADDATPVAQQMVDRRLITAWQAEQLLAGRYKGYFLGNYRILRLLGKGGMNRVFLARHERMEHKCAIKALPAKSVEGANLQRFQREVQAVASLDHPNIVHAHDYDTHGDTPQDAVHYFVMEYIRGSSLLEMVQQQGPLNFTDAADYIRQAAEGLHHAHLAGLVHRDVKPGNLLVSRQGVVKLLDLGLVLSQEQGDEASLTALHSEGVLGTVDYVSPEQARNSHDIDARADIYSLGCTFYFILTGKTPFQDTPPALRLKKHLEEDPPPVASLREDTPLRLIDMIGKMMQKAPEDRYASAAEVADDLEDWLLDTADQAWRMDNAASINSILKARAMRMQGGVDTDSKLKLAATRPVPHAGPVAPSDLASRSDLPLAGDTIKSSSVTQYENMADPVEDAFDLDHPEVLDEDSTPQLAATRTSYEAPAPDVAPAVGIDLGTTFSVVAHLDGKGRPWTIPTAAGDTVTPSVVFFDGGQPIVGKEAVRAAEFEPEHAAQFAKRDMGEREFHKAIGGESLPPEVIQAIILRQLKEDAERKVGPFTKAVVTVPAYFNEPRRKATQDAGRLAGLEVMDIINEPTAAAICYGVQKGFFSTEEENNEDETILVYDLGGGTFDVTLMELKGRSFTTIATAGDVQLGGIDWDKRICDIIAEVFVEQFGDDPRSNEEGFQMLMYAARDAKHTLSVRDQADIDFSYNGSRLKHTLQRDTFEQRCGDLLDRTLLTVERVLREAKRSFADVTRLLLVGGSSRMPMIQAMLQEESGKPVDRSLSPDEAIAHGAAIYAGLLLKQGGKLCEGISVQNVNSHDLGVLGIERSTGMKRRSVLIPRNTSLPSHGKRRFVTARDGQQSVRVKIVEGGDASGNNATEIGNCIVSDLPPGLPAKTPVHVQFRYADNGRLEVEASLEGVESKTSMTIERSSGLTEEMLEKWRQRLEAGKILES